MYNIVNHHRLLVTPEVQKQQMCQTLRAQKQWHWGKPVKAEQGLTSMYEGGISIETTHHVSCIHAQIQHDDGCDGIL